VRIADFLDMNAIIADLTSSDAEGVLAELCQPIATTTGNEKQVLVDALLARERLGSTGVGEGLAIPHAKVPGVRDLVASFGRSRTGVEFKAIDSRPTTFFFVLFAPTGVHGPHLNALARISRIFKTASFRDSLLRARDAHEIYLLIKAEDAQ
jgi:nitrogen PTS system EIIA component